MAKRLDGRVAIVTGGNSGICIMFSPNCFEELRYAYFTSPHRQPR